MEFLSNYGLFLTKGLTVLVLILGTLAGILALLTRTGHATKEHLEVKNLNQRYEAMSNSLKAVILPKKAFRKKLKTDKKRHKTEDREDADDVERKRRVFVIDFHGNVMASAVSSLREEITAILTVAESQDEVVLRLESSGGIVHGYGLAASQLMRIKNKRIPLTVAVDKVAASGGYMMACVANHLLAAPFAVIGSIGVVSQMPNFHRLLKNNNVDFEQFTAGEYKRTLSLFGETTDAGRAKIQEEVDDAHSLFKTFVKTHRQDLDLDKVATGEHWFGTQAHELQLVDELCTSDDYLLAASESADLYQVTFIGKKRLLAQLTGYVSDRLQRREGLQIPYIRPPQ